MPIRIENPFQDPTANLRQNLNPFVEKMRLGQETGDLPVMFGPKLEPLRGAWAQEFAETLGKTPRGIILEIGSHHGDVLSRMATAHPDYGFVGLDITFKRVVTLAEKAKAKNLSNLRSLLCNGKALTEVFAPEELAGVVVFFPDPWVKKKRQQKNRLLSPQVIEGIAKVLQPGGFFWFKTDHKPYFDQVVTATQDHFVPETTPSLLSANTYTSRFEQHFNELGLPTYENCWRRPTVTH